MGEGFCFPKAVVWRWPWRCVHVCVGYLKVACRLSEHGGGLLLGNLVLKMVSEKKQCRASYAEWRQREPEMIRDDWSVNAALPEVSQALG